MLADEPTSGLDSLSAAMVVSSLRKAAKVQGLTVVCTIHQPSREVFLAFDNLLLLKKGGRCVYNGPISSLSNYLSSADSSYAIGTEVNPADHALDVFCGPLGAGTDWLALYNKSEMCKTVMDTVQNPSSEAGEITVDSTPQSFSSELWLVLQRQVVAHWRTTTYMALRYDNMNYVHILFQNYRAKLLFIKIFLKVLVDSYILCAGRPGILGQW